MDPSKTLTVVAHTLKVDFRRPAMSLKFFEQWLLAVALSIVFFADNVERTSTAVLQQLLPTCY